MSTRFRLKMLIVAAAAVVLAFLALSDALAFKVVKNVNSPEPPVEKVVIFAKGETDGIVLKDLSDGSTMSFTDDGEIQAKFEGFAETKPAIKWEAGDKRPDTFDAKGYEYLIIRMKMEGEVKRTHANGKVTSSRPDNLWFALHLLDEEGRRCGSLNLSSVTEDEKMPEEMTTVRIPLLLLRSGGDGDASKVAAVAFYWPKTHDYNDRQFNLVIERITLAD